jgi:hypothetical protein
MGGKILVTKTFGVSQLIYSLQSSRINENDVKDIDAFIFKFLWSKKGTGNRAPDRIKRIVMKQEYEKGGLKVTDIDSFDKALKLKQYLRASKCNHPIKYIQRYIIETLDYDYTIHQDFNRFSDLEDVVVSAQKSVNILTDKLRENINQSIGDNAEIQPFKIDILSGIDVKEYLIRKKMLLLKGYFNTLFRNGIENLKQLVMEASFPRSDRFGDLAKIVLKAFPDGWIRLIESNITCNPEINLRDQIVINCSKLINVGKCTVKNIRDSLFKDNTKFPIPFEVKLDIRQHDNINPFVIARKVNHSTNLRIFKFRLLHMDVFTKERMFKFKMTNNDRCDFCDRKETVKHVLWDCDRARGVWNNIILILHSAQIEIDIKFENIFIGYNPTNYVVEAIITRLTQMLLRIDRVNQLSNEIIKNEIDVLALQNISLKNVKSDMKELWQKIRYEVKK